MTDLPITDAISDRYLAGIDQAAAEGRGMEHMLGYFREVAEHMAANAFLWCDAESERALKKGETAEQVLSRMTNFCDGLQMKVVSWVRAAFVGIGYPNAEAMIAEFEEATARAFSAQLQHLFGGSFGPDQGRQH
ncbi:hypothetical protein P7D22_13555 [Lichenihabitans sp. Uapishka_5]|uniref:hypothetical protein n=1 Tax=Lichenihabitans sp. Uapishka_5 TaxID=3037302 RepID=UPI0029E81968|nr:hypothetical protein [Lichenihabitans sp. Uapishka_5]MDX7952201.1 hypothetical protein [Lichenihabitans sp. Uapishka_5]